MNYQILRPSPTRISLILIIWLLSGCGLTHNQQVKTRSFAQSTQALGQLSSSEFDHIHREIETMNKLYLTLNTSQVTRQFDFLKAISLEKSQVRISTSKALLKYGELIEAIVDKKTSEEIAQIAEGTISLLYQVNDSTLEDAQHSDFKGALEALYHYWLASKQQADLKKLLIQFHPTIEKVANTLKQDFSIKPSSSGYLKAYEITAKRLKLTAAAIINQGNKYTLNERELAVEAYHLATSSLTRAKKLGSKFNKAINRFIATQEQLNKALTNTSYSSSDGKIYIELAKEIKELYQALELLKDREP